MEKSYRMVKARAEASFIERKSEFIGYVSPAYTEEEATAFINSIKKKHYDATHNCSAYIVGESSGIQRSSDDGEPSGTAGIPILEVIRKEGLTNTVVVVTRYFGGILLGAGGLIRAYTEGASIGIKASGIMRIQPFAIHQVHIDYSWLGKLQYEIPKREYLLADTEYSDIVTLKILTLPEESERLHTDVAEWTNGGGIVEYMGVELLKIDEATGKVIS